VVAPVCPLHKETMIRAEVQANTHYKCSLDECPARWDPETRLYYLRGRQESHTRRNTDWAGQSWTIALGRVRSR